MFNLKIVTPEKEIFNENVDQLNVQTSQGELGILPHHVNLLAKLLPGELTIKKGNNTQILAAGSGFIQIVDGQVIVLTDLAVNEKDIDEKAVENAKVRAQTALEQKLSDEEYAETLAILEKSLAQLKVKRRHRSKVN